jgi:predicted acylesterase/phospholipase RssA
MPRTAKRALVLSGGGAKGAFEVGVLAACHHVGLEFDVLTGSSIGAINAVLFAEILRRRRAGQDADGLFNYFLEMWENLDAANLVDFDQLEPLVRDLSKVQVALDDLLHIWWGLTDDSLWERVRGAWHVFWALNELDNILPMSLRDFQRLYSQWQEGANRALVEEQLRTAVRQFLEKHNATRSLLSISALRNALCLPYDDSQGPPLAADQGLSSFYARGIDVRLTRTNVRSGQLELSAYCPPSHLQPYLASSPGGGHIPIVGDPNASAAALASAAFPVAFEPVPLGEIYPPGSPENDALYAILAGSDAAAEIGLTAEDRALLSPSYPLPDDLYLDGGTLDNRPLSAAIAAIKDAARLARTAREAREIYGQTHDVFVVFLGTEPRIRELPADRAGQMLSFEYGLRARELQQNAKLLADIRSAEQITELMEQVAAWKGNARPQRVKVRVTRIFPARMPTSTLRFHRRMGFSRERNRRLIALGCRTMFDALRVPETLARLEDGVQAAVRAVCAGAEGEPWTCAAEGCRLRDACASP